MITDAFPTRRGRMEYVCTQCGARRGVEELLYTCPECGGGFLLEDRSVASCSTRAATPAIPPCAVFSASMN